MVYRCQEACLKSHRAESCESLDLPHPCHEPAASQFPLCPRSCPPESRGALRGVVHGDKTEGSYKTGLHGHTLGSDDWEVTQWEALQRNPIIDLAGLMISRNLRRGESPILWKNLQADETQCVYYGDHHAVTRGEIKNKDSWMG